MKLHPVQQQLLAAITDKSARVGIIGLGYVGLPMAGAFITAGFRVLGFDVDEYDDVCAPPTMARGCRAR